MVDRITAAELADDLEAVGDAFTLVDTRQPDSFEDWHLADAENVPFDPTEGFDRADRERVEAAADGDDVVAICGKGLTSTPFGIHLEDSDYDGDVTVVRGGMEAYAAVHEVAEIEGDGGDGPDGEDGPGSDRETERDAGDGGGDGPGDPLIYQFQRPATGCLSYLIGSAVTREAILVDPTRHTERFALVAEAAGLQITGVVDTHVHADHLSGGPALAEALDVPYRVGVAVDDPAVDHEHEPLVEGQTIDLGEVGIEVLHAPGHTMELATLLVDDEYLLSADALHLESVGRTELGFGEDEADRGAELLYESLRESLLTLDDGVVVLPGHVSITDDIRFETGEPGEPIRKRLGAIVDDLEVLGYDRAAFIEDLAEDRPEQPHEYETVVAVNAGHESVDSEEDAAELETGPNSCSA